MAGILPLRLCTMRLFTLNTTNDASTSTTAPATACYGFLPNSQCQYSLHGCAATRTTTTSTTTATTAKCCHY